MIKHPLKPPIFLSFYLLHILKMAPFFLTLVKNNQSANNPQAYLLVVGFEPIPHCVIPVTLKILNTNDISGTQHK